MNRCHRREDTRFLGILLLDLMHVSNRWQMLCYIVYWLGNGYLQANTTDELPERLIGAVRVSHIDLKSAIVPKLEPDPSWWRDN